MAEVKLNDNGRIVNGSLTVNDNGVIKDIDSMNVYINIANEVIQFPSKETCIMNLDRTSMMTPYTFGYGSSFLSPNKGFEIAKIDGGIYSRDLDGYINDNNTNATANGVNITDSAAGGNPYWYIGYGFSGIKVRLSEVINSSFTYQVCFTPFGSNQAWNEISLIGKNTNNSRFRLEMTDNANKCCFYSDNEAIKQQLSGLGYINISRTEKNWIACSFDITTKTFTRYQNGRSLGSIVLNDNIEMEHNEIGFNCQKTMRVQPSVNNIRYYSIRIFNSCLNADEIRDLSKIDFMNK